MRNIHLKPVVLGLLFAGALVQQATAAAPSAPQGVITARVYTDIGNGTAVTDLAGNAKFPDSPDIIRYEPYFELWATGNILTAPVPDVMNSYGAQIVGYFYPQTSGLHTFYICSDDNSQLYLSTDETPENKHLIARESAWSNPREYTTSGAPSDLTAKNSYDFTGSTWPGGGTAINLTANKAYYIEALMKEGGGGDNLSVSIDGGAPIPGDRLASIDKTTGPLSITTQPQPVTVTEGQPYSFSVELNGTPPYQYQWTKDDQDIAGATTKVLSVARAAMADNNKTFKCKVTGASGNLTTDGAKLTVNADTTTPTLVSARATLSFNSVLIVFSKPMDKVSAETKGNYSFNPALTISTAVLQPNLTTVALTPSAKLAEGIEYTVTVTGVKDDTVAAHPVPANSTATFKTWNRVSGFLTAEFFTGISGTAVADLTGNQKYIDSLPDEVRLLSAFDTPSGYGDNYGVRVTGWLVPKVSGNYDFFIRSDDASQLFISANETPPDPAVDLPVCAETGCCNAFLEPGANQTTVAPIALVAGRKYAVLALMKEGTGGDFLQVAWRQDTDSTAAASLLPMPGSLFETYADTTGASIEFTTAPVDTQGVDGKKATFTAAVTTSSQYVSYQWLVNGSELSGATLTTYTTPLLSSSYNNRRYSIKVTIPGLTKTSAEATLTVVPDTFPPVPTVGALVNTNGTTIDVGVGFDEDVDSTTGVQANFSVAAPGSISKFTWNDKSKSALLQVTGLTPGGTGTVTVKNVKDLKGNAITSVDKQFTVSTTMKWGVVGGQGKYEEEVANWPMPVKGNWVVPVSANGFDVYSDGRTEWNNYDEATFVYEEITGDFDKKVRVEYQDNSSQWARAGLIVREVTNFGVDLHQQIGTHPPNSNTDDPPFDGLAGRYQKCHVNPVGPTMTGPGTAGNGSWEGNRRMVIGGPCSSPGGGGVPLYPNAWCRIQRQGQLFSIYRSDNGVNWILNGTTTFPAPMPAKLYVGPEFSPENGNISNEADRGVWLAMFRDYGDTFGVEPGKPKLSSTVAADGSVTLTYTGTLVSSATVKGAYAPVTGAASPYKVDPKISTQPATFYQTRSP